MNVKCGLGATYLEGGQCGFLVWAPLINMSTSVQLMLQGYGCTLTRTGRDTPSSVPNFGPKSGLIIGRCDRCGRCCTSDAPPA